MVHACRTLRSKLHVTMSVGRIYYSWLSFFNTFFVTVHCETSYVRLFQQNVDTFLCKHGRLTYIVVYILICLLLVLQLC